MSGGEKGRKTLKLCMVLSPLKAFFVYFPAVASTDGGVAVPLKIMEVFEHMRWHGSNSPYARLTLICCAQKIMKHAENKRYRHYLIPDVLHSLRHGSSNWEQRKACICLKHVSGQCLGRFDKRVIGALEEVVERCGRHRLRHCAESALVKFRARVL